MLIQRYVRIALLRSIARFCEHWLMHYAVRKQYALTASIYAKRSEAIAKIPNFWPLVIEQAPPEIDQFIQPQDSRILTENLINIEIRRPELDDTRPGNPRSLHFKFEFKPNDEFEDTILEKTFWHRRAKDGWTGLVSEPVNISWKKGKDATEGLTDMARALFEARMKVGDMTAKGLPEYTSLKKKVEHWNGMNTSFFTWFGWVSGRRWVSQEESERANEEYSSLRERRRGGEKVVYPGEQESDEEHEVPGDDEAVEVHQAGEELAISLAEDLWPNAIKFFTQAQEIEEMSDADFEELDMDDDDAEEGDEQPVDIRSLVQPRSRPSNGDGPSSKRQKKA